MVSKEKLIFLKNWFKKYYESFKREDDDFNSIIELKYNHSLRVCSEIIDIGESCELHENELRLAETMALLHDLGRFEQYSNYLTFSDKKSLNHSGLAVKILEENKVLNDLSPETTDLIYNCILNHNKLEIPYESFGDELFYSKLLRDADKIDIFYVFTDYFENRTLYPGNTIELDLPDIPDINEENLLFLESGKLIKSENLKSFNDFKLMQLSWLFDINFSRSYEIIKERHYIEKIFNFLPYSEKTIQAKTNVLNYLNKIVAA